jgi:hypothetical protein
MAAINENLIATIILLGLAVLLLIGGTIIHHLPKTNPYIINGGKTRKMNIHKKYKF